MFHIGPSAIHGQGIILDKFYKPGDRIAIGIYYGFLFPVITDNFGKWINHSWNPTGYLDWDNNRRAWWVAAKYNLYPGTELTVDYRFTPDFIKKPDPKWII